MIQPKYLQVGKQIVCDESGASEDIVFVEQMMNLKLTLCTSDLASLSKQAEPPTGCSVYDT